MGRAPLHPHESTSGPNIENPGRRFVVRQSRKFALKNRGGIFWPSPIAGAFHQKRRFFAVYLTAGIRRARRHSHQLKKKTGPRRPEERKGTPFSAAVAGLTPTKQGAQRIPLWIGGSGRAVR